MRGHGEGSISLRKDGRYQVRVRYTDHRGMSQRAYAYRKSEREARAALKELLRRVEDQEVVNDSAVTVGTWVETWIGSTLAASSRRATTKSTYESLLRTHIVPQLGAIRLRALTPAHVEDWIRVTGERRSASTTRQAHAVLVMVLDTAVRHELLKRNVAKLVDRPRKSRVEAACYTSAEVGMLRTEAHGQRLGPLLSLIAFTGLRKGEALALQWTDVQFTGPSPTLRVSATLARIGGRLVRTEPKTSASRRTVPLVAEAVEALREARSQQRKDKLAAGPAWSDSGLVFTTEVGTPIDPRNALRWFYSIRDSVSAQQMVADLACTHSHALAKSGRKCEACGRAARDYLGGSIHTLRHSAASVLLGAGVPMPVVKEVLGHSSIMVTVDMYGHMAPSVLANAMALGMAGFGGRD